LDTGTQRHRNTGTKRHQDTWTPEHWETGVEGHRDDRRHEEWRARRQEAGRATGALGILRDLEQEHTSSNLSTSNTSVA